MPQHSGVQAFIAREVNVNPLLRWVVRHGRVFEAIVLQYIIIEAEISCELGISSGSKANDLSHGTTAA